MSKNLLSSGATSAAVSSVTITGLPDDAPLRIVAYIHQYEYITNIVGFVPKTSAPTMVKKSWLRRLFSRQKYDYVERGRCYEIHSPNGLPFDCEWSVYEN